jgi:MFS family permease
VTTESRLDRVGWSALRYPSFRLFFSSMLSFSSGGFVMFSALGWYVLQLTGSAAAVGVAFSAYGLPALLLTAHAGVLTDRFGSRRMLVISFAAIAVFSGAQAIAALAGTPPYLLLIALAFGLGVAQAIGTPASVAIVSDLVPPPALSSAVTLNFLHMNAARIVGGMLGGSLLAVTSPAVAFAAAGLLAAAPAVALSRLPTMSDGGARLERPRSALIGPLVEAFRYAFGHPTLGVLIVLAIAPGTIGLGYIFVLPLAAKELGIGAGGLGALLVISGGGGLLAGLSLEAVHRRVGHGRGVFGGLTGASVGMVAFGLAPGVPLALLALVVVGGSILTYGASSVTLIQALAPARLRGRMVSLFALLYWGMLPVGSLLTGLVAEVTTARITVLLCGIGLALAGVTAFVVRPQLATLAVARDGRTLTGDLIGSGAEVG